MNQSAESTSLPVQLRTCRNKYRSGLKSRSIHWLPNSRPNYSSIRLPGSKLIHSTNTWTHPCLILRDAHIYQCPDLCIKRPFCPQSITFNPMSAADRFLESLPILLSPSFCLKFFSVPFIHLSDFIVLRIIYKRKRSEMISDARNLPSPGSGEAKRALIEIRAVLTVNAGDHVFLSISRQMAPV